jgi:hypothetical protein
MEERPVSRRALRCDQFARRQDFVVSMHIRNDNHLHSVPFQKCRQLAKAEGKFRSRRSVEQLAEDILRPLNDGTSTAEGTMSLNQFVEELYLPYVEEQKRRSTYCGYKNLWIRYIQQDGQLALRDFRTLDGQQMLRSIATREDLSRPTLGHIKHFLSGVFRYARRQGVLNSPNPMHDVEIPKGRPAGETYAYSLEAEALMLTLLPEPAATVVATAAFHWGTQRRDPWILVAKLRWLRDTG